MAGIYAFSRIGSGRGRDRHLHLGEGKGFAQLSGGDFDEESPLPAVDVDLRQCEDRPFDVDGKRGARPEGARSAELVPGVALRRALVARLYGLDAEKPGERLRRNLAVAVHE